MAAEPDKPSAGDENDFRALVEELLQGALKNAVAQTELRPGALIDGAANAREEIEAAAAAQREAVDELRIRVRNERLLRVAQAGGGLLIGLLGLGSILIPISDLVLLPGVALVGIALLIALFLLRDRSSALSTPSTKSTRADLSLGDQLSEAEADYAAGLENALRAWINERANRDLGDIYAAKMPALDPTGLAEIDDPDHEIPTGAAEKLERAIRHMPGGSLGISGPRGAGKTTLLSRVTVRARHEDPSGIRAAIVVDAPVDYDGRDFVLHLFARLCEDVLGAPRVEAMRAGGFSPGALAALAPFRTFPGAIGPALLVVGAIAYAALLDAQNKLDPASLEIWALAVTGLGGLLTYLTLLMSTMRRSGLRARLSASDEAPSRSLTRAAERHLRRIWFQRTFSAGWSGGLKVPIGVQGGVEKSTQLAENQLSLPDIVDRYTGFVRSLGREGQVRIGIDELDKMDDEQARRFLNEIKMIFRVSGCFYIVSVSEDAMAYFERRGLPFRDVFDSAFDGVTEVGYLSFVGSRRMLRRRVIGMPIQFIYLCHVLGGGLPRDVIRQARAVYDEQVGESIGKVAENLCKRELSSKCSAARVAVRRLEDPAQVTLLSEWLTKVGAANADPALLLDRCRELSRELVIPLGPLPSADAEQALASYRDALSIALEVAAFAYFMATLRQYFVTLDSPESARGAAHSGAIDKLAEARQAFTLSPSEAWEAISSVRRFPIAAEERVEFPSLDHTAPPSGDQTEPALTGA